MGGVYLGETNVALSLLEQGAARVDDATLKGLPLGEQVRLLAAEKAVLEKVRSPQILVHRFCANHSISVLLMQTLAERICTSALASGVPPPVSMITSTAN